MTTPPLTPAQEMQQRYRNVFGSAEGRLVLGDILTLGHYFETIDPNDPVMAAEHNFAEVIARMSGLFDSLYHQLGLDGVSSSAQQPEGKE